MAASKYHISPPKSSPTTIYTTYQDPLSSINHTGDRQSLSGRRQVSTSLKRHTLPYEGNKHNTTDQNERKATPATVIYHQEINLYRIREEMQGVTLCTKVPTENYTRNTISYCPTIPISVAPKCRHENQNVSPTTLKLTSRQQNTMSDLFTTVPTGMSNPKMRIQDIMPNMTDITNKINDIVDEENDIFLQDQKDMLIQESAEKRMWDEYESNLFDDEIHESLTSFKYLEKVETSTSDYHIIDKINDILQEENDIIFP